MTPLVPFPNLSSPSAIVSFIIAMAVGAWVLDWLVRKFTDGKFGMLGAVFNAWGYDPREKEIDELREKIVSGADKR